MSYILLCVAAEYIAKWFFVLGDIVLRFLNVNNQILFVQVASKSINKLVFVREGMTINLAMNSMTKCFSSEEGLNVRCLQINKQIFLCPKRYYT